MSSFAETVAFIFGLIALGYASGLSGLLKEETGDALADFAVTVALPLLLFKAVAEADFGGSLPGRLWTAYFLAIAATWLVAQMIVRHGFGRDARASVVGGLAASFSNIALLGVPFVLGIYGQEALNILLLILAVHLPVMMAATILLFSWLGGPGAPSSLGGALRTFLIGMAKSPLIIGILAGVLWRATGLEMPSLMARLVDTFAAMAAPVALFAIGLGLRRFGVGGNVPAAVVIVGLKLLLMPFFALLMAKFIGLPPLSAKVIVASASLPAGVNPYLIAKRFGTGEGLASSALSIGTVSAVVTTAFWLWVAQRVFG